MTPMPPPPTLRATGAPADQRSSARPAGFLSTTWLRNLPLLLLATACAAPATVPPPAPRAPIPTPAGILSEIEPAARPSPKPIHTPPACSETTGNIEQGALDIRSDPRPLEYRIYLPPCVEESGSEGLPTLYLLHGLGASDAQWDELGTDEAADALILSGAIPPMLMVMPRDRSGMDLETALVEALLPHVEASYPARAERGSRAIGGLSRGAAWAFRIGLKNPDLFFAVGLHSPAVPEFDRAYVYFWVRDLAVPARPALWLDIGDRDSLIHDTRSLIARLEEIELMYTAHLYPGGHSPDYWSQHMETYLRWYAGQFEIAARIPSREPR